MKATNILVLLTLLMLCSVSALAFDSALFHLNNLTPSNGTFDTDGAVTFNFNISGNATSNYLCNIYINSTNSTYSVIAATSSNIYNFTYRGNLSEIRQANLTATNLRDGHIAWTVGCSAPGNSTLIFPDVTLAEPIERNLSFLRRFIVDTKAPNITINSPLNRSWHKDGKAVFFNISVYENNTDGAFCVLDTNLNETLNSTGGGSLFFNFTTRISGLPPLDSSNHSILNFSFGNNTYTRWLDNNTGAYLWDVICNDSAGNTARFGQNSTFFVDSKAPPAPTFNFPANNSLSTDRTPGLQWLNFSYLDGELNFSHYEIQIDNDSDFASPEFELNLSDRNLNQTVVTSGNLSFDKQYYIRAVTYDLAGWSNTSTPVYYETDGTCGTLYASEWNICAMVRTTPINASALCDEVGCAYISLYNKSHQFQTYTDGSSTNDEMVFFSGFPDVNSSSVVFIFPQSSSNSSWENRTAQVNAPHLLYNLTNTSTSGWNIVPILNKTHRFTIGDIGLSLNRNFSATLNGNHSLGHNESRFLSYYVESNITTARYLPWFVGATSNVYNNTVVDYGDAIWININSTSIHGKLWNSSDETQNVLR